MNDVKSLEEVRRKEEWAIWDQRYEGLQKMMDILEGRLSADFPGRETIRALLAGLRVFADRQFAFLHNGFAPERGNGYRLERSLRYPADFVLGGTLNQVAFDLVVFQGALEQRLQANDNDAMRRTFEVADRLADYALRPALWYGLLPYEEGEIEVLTYFQKAPHVRLIPYASVALVAIPYTALATYEGDRREEVGNARDLLAIPHEIGHYVYQHGVTTDSRLNVALFEVLQGKPEWLLDWAEEIFADVYGCFVAGPVIMRDFQDLMRGNDVETLLDDDSEHPTPALRPFLYCDALRILADKAGDEAQRSVLKGMAKVADSSWETFLRGRGAEHIEERRKIIQEAIEETFDVLTKRHSPEPVSIDLRRLWSVPVSSSDDHERQYNDLYETFRAAVADGSLFARIDEHTPEQPGEAGTGGGAVETAEAGSAEESAPREEKVEEKTGPQERKMDEKSPMKRMRTLRSLERIREHLMEKAEEGSSDASGEDELIPAEVWTLVASMHGWATEGPGGQPNPKFG